MITTAAVFLDRDGTINIDNHYVHNIDNFFFIERVIHAMAQVQRMGFILIIVTNQSGIARGFFTEQQFLLLTKWMINYLKKYGVYIHAVYYCPHHIEGKVKKFQKFCFCRKPNPGMLFNAEKRFCINMKQSYIVGNSETDMLAGKLANVGTRIFICNNYDKIKKDVLFFSADYIIENLTHLPSIINNKKCHL
uniref:D,D-heptose 1,7-bisphosphate phosphatase n=1 Tax=Blochmannia endosymbiont of Camponotus atriceps TaxID=698791 RepID=D2XN56_9ENTR|nr:D,D-heptose 1,7-bisphosphate phosphatase [Blochmannia endosymbiont of Camponotus atriceps]